MKLPSWMSKLAARYSARRERKRLAQEIAQVRRPGNTASVEAALALAARMRTAQQADAELQTAVISVLRSARIDPRAIGALLDLTVLSMERQLRVEAIRALGAVAAKSIRVNTTLGAIVTETGRDPTEVSAALEALTCRAALSADAFRVLAELARTPGPLGIRSDTALRSVMSGWQSAGVDSAESVRSLSDLVASGPKTALLQATGLLGRATTSTHAAATALETLVRSAPKPDAEVLTSAVQSLRRLMLRDASLRTRFRALRSHPDPLVSGPVQKAIQADIGEEPGDGE